MYGLLQRSQPGPRDPVTLVYYPFFPCLSILSLFFWISTLRIRIQSRKLHTYVRVSEGGRLRNGNAISVAFLDAKSG